MAEAGNEPDDPGWSWIVDCPRHGRAKITLDRVDQPRPGVRACTVFSEGESPTCDKACLEQFNLAPRPGGLTDELPLPSRKEPTAALPPEALGPDHPAWG